MVTSRTGGRRPVTDTIEQKALALVNEVRTEYPLVSSEVASNLALCRAIEQYDAFRQGVSDAVVKATHTMAAGKLVAASGILAAFIIPKPVDPLVEALNDLGWKYDDNGVEIATELREALAKRGYEIREKAGD